MFDLIKSGQAKIRIFFRNNRHKALGLTDHHRDNEFTILYYEFIKHAFGLEFCDYPVAERYVRLYIDDIPARGSQIGAFKRFILGLNNSDRFRNNHVHIRENDIIEVDSSLHLPLQLLDLVLGAICFRLNDKHKIKSAETGKRGKRTILKEKLYRHILHRIREIRPNFNIGVSTGITSPPDRWNHPYRHWSFIPLECETDPNRKKP